MYCRPSHELTKNIITCLCIRFKTYQSVFELRMFLASRGIAPGKQTKAEHLGGGGGQIKCREMNVTPTRNHLNHNYTLNTYSRILETVTREKYIGITVSNDLKGHCIEFKYYADGIHAGLTPPG